MCVWGGGGGGVYCHYRLPIGARAVLVRSLPGVARPSPFPASAAPGRSHPRPLQAPPASLAWAGAAAAALGPGGRGLRRGLGGRSSADPGSRLPAPCEGARGPRGAGRSPGEVSGRRAGAGSGRGALPAARGGGGEPPGQGEDAGPQVSPRPTPGSGAWRSRSSRP